MESSSVQKIISFSSQSKHLTSDYISYILVTICIFTLAYDNFPFPFNMGGSLVTPLSLPILIICACFIFIASKDGLIHTKIDKALIIFLIFPFYSIFFSGIQSLYNDFNIKLTSSADKFYKGSLAVLGFYIGLLVFYNFSKKYGFEKIIRIAYLSSIFPIFIGFLQFFCILFKLKYFNLILLTVGKIFSSSEVDIDSRVRVLTLEPSWAAQQYICFFLPIALIYRHLSHTVSSNIILFMCILGLIGTQSGVLIVWGSILLSIFLINEVFKLSNGKIKLNRLISIGMCIFFGMILLYQKNLFTYQKSKIDIIMTQSVAVEPSSGIRFGNLLTGLKCFFDHPFFGVGFGQFGFYYKKYAPLWVQSFGEGFRWADPYDPYFATAKNLYVRLLVETGLIGFLMFFVPIFMIFFKLLWKKNIINFYLALSIFGVLVSCFNTDSLLFLYMPFMLAISIVFLNIEKQSKN